MDRGFFSGIQLQGLTPISARSTPEAKIALFGALFRGRDDVYARRFENARTGKSGYAPACAHEWVRGLCDKPRVRCAECPHRRFLPLTDEVLRMHLTGHDPTCKPCVVGVYPLLPDETCWFLALDFDKQDWREDASALRLACEESTLACAVERSRSGNGAHVWLFFAEALPAVLARKLGAALLTRAMERRPEIGLASYDRMFPNQDTLPSGGFGNLIALPLQRAARERGNSLFLDASLEPISDPWAFLADLARVPRAAVERIVGSVEARHGNVLALRVPVDEDPDVEPPWRLRPSRACRNAPPAGPFPARLELVVADGVYVPRDGLSPSLRNRILRLAAFQNPEFYAAQARRMPTHGIPRAIGCAEEHANHIALPRGCLDDLQALLRGVGIAVDVRDEREHGTPFPTEFQGALRPEQRAAAAALVKHDCGVLSATTAFGKTVLAAWLIAHRGVNTLVLVHRRQLLEQWVERLSSFLELPPAAIGRIGGGRRRPNGRLDVALIQSLVRKGQVHDDVARYGHVIVDECHRLPAVSFEQVARRVRARYVLGLSATPTRKDGHHPILFMQCGPIRHRVAARDQARTSPFVHSVVVCPTGFRATGEPVADARLQYLALCDDLSRDARRNHRIAADVRAALTEGRSPLVITERTAHLEALAALLAPHVADLVILRGGMGVRDLRDARERLLTSRDSASRVVLATGRYAGEGFDDAKLDTLFLTMPISWRGTVAQYAGRLHRLHDGKHEARIVDYADLDVPMLARMFDRRCRAYEAIGYHVRLPASALPGWPVDVPLPVEPDWKHDHADTVRRLLRDGVEAHLGNLFVHAACAPPLGAAGTDRARSATEAFFYRRLQTLPETTGRFVLNARLPVPLGASSDMEVDLLCGDARLVVELDGDQHLGDAEAYRRDRRKDALLQEKGYFVLRFLAEDVHRRLGSVLDAVLRTLGHLKART